MTSQEEQGQEGFPLSRQNGRVTANKGRVKGLPKSPREERNSKESQESHEYKKNKAQELGRKSRSCFLKEVLASRVLDGPTHRTESGREGKKRGMHEVFESVSMSLRRSRPA